MDTLASLLEQAGYDFLVRGEEAHLVFTDGRVRWHAVCVEQKEAVLIYSRYPFRMEDETQALYACNRINAVDLWGAFLFGGWRRRRPHPCGPDRCVLCAGAVFARHRRALRVGIRPLAGVVCPGWRKFAEA